MKNNTFFPVLIIALGFWSSYAMDSKAPSVKHGSSKVSVAAPKRKLSFGACQQVPVAFSMPVDLSLLERVVDKTADQCYEPKAPKMKAVQSEDDIPPLSLDVEKKSNSKTEYRNASPEHKKPRLRSRSLFQGRPHASLVHDEAVSGSHAATIIGVFMRAKKAAKAKRVADRMRDEVIQETLKIILAKAFVCIDYKSN